MTPIVFVHGFLGGSLQWQGQSKALCASGIVAVDLPGFGENAHLQPLDTIGAYAEWVLDHMTSRGIERFHLLGHSMGGMIAQEMVARAPSRIERLVLYGTGATGELPGRFETIDVSKRRARDDGPRVTARRIAATWFVDHEHAASFESCADLAERTSLRAILAGLDAMHLWRGDAQLQDIRVPTLILWGDHDRTYPWSQTEHLWTSISDASLAVLPNCAHASHLEKPDLFNSLLRDFLAP